MTRDAHPSFESLADLHEGVLDDEAADHYEAHVADCDECAAAMSALAQVEQLVAAEGARTLEMPADLADSLHDQLRRLGAERQGGVPSLTQRRAGSAAVRRPRGDTGQPSRRARTAGLGAAAAVLGAACVWGVSQLGDSPRSADSASSGRSAAAAPELDAQQGGGSSNQDAEPRRQEDLTRPKSRAPEFTPLRPQSLRRFAAALAAAPVDGVVADTRYCPAAGRLPDGFPAAASSVRWQGDPAFVVVRTTERRVSVYSCDSPLRELYATAY